MIELVGAGEGVGERHPHRRVGRIDAEGLAPQCRRTDRVARLAACDQCELVKRDRLRTSSSSPSRVRSSTSRGGDRARGSPRCASSASERRRIVGCLAVGGEQAIAIGRFGSGGAPRFGVLLGACHLRSGPTGCRSPRASRSADRSRRRRQQPPPSMSAAPGEVSVSVSPPELRAGACARSGLRKGGSSVSTRSPGADRARATRRASGAQGLRRRRASHRGRATRT